MVNGMKARDDRERPAAAREYTLALHRQPNVMAMRRWNSVERSMRAAGGEPGSLALAPLSLLWAPPRCNMS
jgi:hypothetical protein